MHNMIIEDECDINAPVKDARPAPQATIEMTINKNIRFQQFLTRNLHIKNQETHFILQYALIDYI